MRCNQIQWESRIAIEKFRIQFVGGEKGKEIEYVKSLRYWRQDTITQVHCSNEKEI